MHRSRTKILTLIEEERLDGKEVLPGFCCPVSEVFGLLQQEPTRPGSDLTGTLVSWIA